MKHKAPIVAGLVAVALALQVLPAQAATYLWLSGKISPNGTVYVDAVTKPVTTQYSRTGISAEIDQSNGYTWKTQVWFGTATTSGAASAYISDTRSFKKTKVSYKYLFGVDDDDKITVFTRLLDAKLSGASRIADPSSPADTTLPTLAEETEYEQPLGLLLESNQVPGVEVKQEGDFEGYKIWSGIAKDGAQYLYATKGDLVAATHVDAEQFESAGISLSVSNGYVPVQLYKAPSSLTKLSDDLGSSFVSESVVARLGVEESIGSVSAKSSSSGAHIVFLGLE